MTLKSPTRSRQDLEVENEELRAALDEAQEMLRAIRAGEVDALVVSTPEGEQVFTLQGADRTYRSLIEEMNEGALTLAPDGMILYANQRFAAMLKTPLEKVIGSPMSAWVIPECQADLELLLKQGAKGKHRQELSLAAADGTAVEIYLSVSPVSLDGVRNYVGAVATDLTEQKQAEQALRFSESKFRSLFENASVGKSLLDMDGRRQSNSALQDFLGYSATELEHLRWQDFTHPDDIAATQAALDALESGRLASARFEKRFIHKSGKVVWADMTLSLVKDAAGKPMYLHGEIHDITARKEADAALLELKQHLHHYIEMERLHLAQDLHDVPLQELYSILYRLEEVRSTALPDTEPVIGDVIADIRETLASIRMIASELRPPSITKLGFQKSALAYIQGFQEKHPGIQVKASLERDQQALPDPVRVVLLRVLQEAFHNVERHTQATEIDVRFVFDSRRASLEVVDNGKGFEVPPDWSSLTRDGHYGLAGMAERVDAAGGVLDVTSTPGTSTTVRVAIPLVPVHPASPRKAGSRKPQG